MRRTSLTVLVLICAWLPYSKGSPRPKSWLDVDLIPPKDLHREANFDNCSSQVDVVFLLDSSGSIRQFYEAQKSLAAELIEQFQVGYNTTRVALLQYSGYPQVEFSLGEYYRREEILRKLTEVQFRSGVTRTGAALNEAKRQFLSGGRQSADKILILMTDGVSLDDPLLIAKLLRDTHKVSLYCVCFPEDGYMPELEEIAGSQHKVFLRSQLDSFKKEVKREISQISYRRCNSTPIELTSASSVSETTTVAEVSSNITSEDNSTIFHATVFNLNGSLNDSQISEFSSEMVIPTPEAFLLLNTSELFETNTSDLPTIKPNVSREHQIRVLNSNLTKNYSQKLRSLLAFALQLSRLDGHLLDRLSTVIDQRLGNHNKTNLTEMSLNNTDNHMVDMMTDMIMHNLTNATNFEKIINGILADKINQSQADNETDWRNITTSADNSATLIINSTAEELVVHLRNTTGENESEVFHHSNPLWIPQSNASFPDTNTTVGTNDFLIQSGNFDEEKTNLTESLLTAEGLENQMSQLVRRAPAIEQNISDVGELDRISYKVDSQTYQREETQHIPTAPSCPTDIIFLLDSSGSMTNHFVTEKELINSVVKGLDMSKHRVAIAQFAGTENQRIELDFNDFQTKDNIMGVLDGLEHQKGTTAFGKALNFTTELLLSKRRPVARSVLILLTDGFSQDDAVIPARIIAGQLKTKIFGIGLEELNDRAYLEKVVGDKQSVYIGTAERDVFKSHFNKYINGC